VIDAKVFSRKGQEKDDRTKFIEDQEKARLLKNQADEIRIIQNSTRRKIGKYLIGKRPITGSPTRRKPCLSGNERGDQGGPSLQHSF
jgi:DNA-directed RNA polymerase subunit beta